MQASFASITAGDTCEGGAAASLQSLIGKAVESIVQDTSYPKATQLKLQASCADVVLPKLPHKMHEGLAS